MRNETRRLFNAYLDDVAQLNNIDNPRERFTVDPEVEIALEEIIAEEVGFLNRIESTEVEQQTGKKAGLDMGDPVASNTDTSGDKERQAVDPHNTKDLDDYFCHQINSDTALRYELIDKWRHRGDFAAIYASVLAKRQGRDRILMGFYGTHRAINSDRSVNKKLQDVAEGWLEKLRKKDEGSSVLSFGRQAENEIRVGYKVNVADGTETKGDFANIDAMALDLVDGKIDEWYQDDTDLVCIVGRQLMHDKEFSLAQNNLPATEHKAALDIIVSNRTVGGMKAMRVPLFPPRGMLITPLDNLDIVRQKGTRRRQILDNAKKDQVEEYQSLNMDYVINDFGRIAYAESDNVKLLDEVTGNWV